MPGAKSHFEKNVFLELLLRITEEEKWNLFEKLGQLRTPTVPALAGLLARPLGLLQLDGLLAVRPHPRRALPAAGVLPVAHCQRQEGQATGCV